MIERGQIPAPTKIPGLGLRWSSDALRGWLDDVLAAQDGATQRRAA